MASMDPTAGLEDIDPRDVDSEAVVDELDVVAPARDEQLEQPEDGRVVLDDQHVRHLDPLPRQPMTRCTTCSTTTSRRRSGVTGFGT